MTSCVGVKFCRCGSEVRHHILEACEVLSAAPCPLMEERVRGTCDSKAEASVPSAAARSILCSLRAGPHSGRGLVSRRTH